jgi:phosphatidylcholine synthase
VYQSVHRRLPDVNGEPKDMTPQQLPTASVSAADRLFAWTIHAYTATGAVAAFAATLAIFDERYRAAFFLLVAATMIDGTDGVLARLARVKDVTPGFDGARLDDIVDYLTFVFVPLLLLYRAGDLPLLWGGATVMAVLLSSAYGFCVNDAKTDDGFFTGLAPGVNAAILLVLSVLIFARNGYVYPTRTPVLRGLTIALGSAWGLMVLGMIAMMPDVPGRLVIVSLFFPVYYAVLSFTLDARRGHRS